MNSGFADKLSGACSQENREHFFLLDLLLSRIKQSPTPAVNSIREWDTVAEGWADLLAMNPPGPFTPLRRQLQPSQLV